MSEYQYYEFAAIDHPLTEKRQSEVASLSSRADVTPYRASFVYNYGDFRGNVEKLMATHFDAMLYMTNWGNRRLMFRIPRTLIDMNQVAPFCISEEIDHWSSQDGQNIILDLHFHEEEPGGAGWGWAEGKGWLDELIGLRQELIQGDFRGLYLAWLRAAENAIRVGDINSDSLEPPVPHGLTRLSNAQKAYVRFLEIDEGMLAVAAEQSGEQPEAAEVTQWIGKLEDEEKHEFLMRLSRGETNLSVILNRRLHELARKEMSHEEREPARRRTISSLIESAARWRQQKKEAEKKQAELAREKELKSLAKREDSVWKTVYALIEEKKSGCYVEAVKLLNDLRELAEYRREWRVFNKHIENIRTTYAKRTALLRRMRSFQLIEKRKDNPCQMRLDTEQSLSNRLDNPSISVNNAVDGSEGASPCQNAS